MKCPYCNAPMEEELLNYAVTIDNQEVQLEDVPTWVCDSCDHTQVEEDVIEAVEDMLAHLDTVQANSEEE